MLEYMYSGWSRERMDEAAPALYQLASRYEVEQLLRDAESAMLRQLSVASFSKVAVVAREHEVKTLLDAVLAFAAKKKNMKLLRENADFLALFESHGALARTIFLQYMQRNKL